MHCRGSTRRYCKFSAHYCQRIKLFLSLYTSSSDDDNAHTLVDLKVLRNETHFIVAIYATLYIFMFSSHQTKRVKKLILKWFLVPMFYSSLCYFIQHSIVIWMAREHFLQLLHFPYSRKLHATHLSGRYFIVIRILVKFIGYLISFC